MSHILYIKYVTSALRVPFCIHDYENGYDTQYKQPIQYVKPVILITQYMTSYHIIYHIISNFIPISIYIKQHKFIKTQHDIEDMNKRPKRPEAIMPLTKS